MWRRRVPYLIVFALALGLRLWMPGPVQVTTDEPLWLLRSAQFSNAITHGDLSRATAWGAVPGIDYPTMPGVTTMWAGTAGRGLMNLGHELGWNKPVPEDPLASATLLRLSRAMVAMLVSAGLAVFAWVAGRLVGRRAGLLAGTLCAIEPWYVGHSFVLHTDALVTTFGVTSIVAMAAAFGGRERGSGATGHEGRVRFKDVLDPTMVVVSGIAGGLAILTKLNGLAIVGGGIAIVAAVGIMRRLRRTGFRAAVPMLRRLLGWALIWAVIVVGVFTLAWPAVWVQPLGVLRHLRLSLSHPAPIATQFFMGAPTHHPGPAFYPVTLAFRISPWLLVGLVAAIGISATRLVARTLGAQSIVERLPALPWIVVGALLPYGVAMSRYTRVYDRYALVFVPAFALVVAGGIVAVVDRLGARRAAWRRPGMIGLSMLAVFGVATGYVASEAPFAISYIDPMLGGQTRAEQVMMLGWGEGAAPLGERIAEDNGGRCARVRIDRPGGNLIPAEFPCGSKADYPELKRGDYVVLDLNQVQRDVTARAISRKYGLGLKTVDVTRIHGVAYVTLYQVTSVADAR